MGVFIMFKRLITVTKDYFSLINFKNKYLITFIIVDLINVLVSLLIPYFASQIIEAITNALYTQAIIHVLLLMIIQILVKSGSFCTNWCYANFFKGVYVDIHRKLVKSIFNYDENYTKKVTTGKILNSSNGDILNIAELPSFIIELSIEVIKLSVIYWVFFKSNLLVALYVVLIDALYLKYAKICNTKSAYHSKKQREYADKMTGMLSQILTGLKDVKSFDNAEKINNKIDTFRNKWQTNYFLKRKYFFTRKTFVNLLVDLGKIGLYFMMILLLMKGQIHISLFLLLTSYFDKTRESLNDIMAFDISIMDEAISLYRIKDILAYGTQTLKLDGSLNNDTLIGRVEFKNVYFKYENKYILKSISFIAEPHRVTTIVGKTGAGKTTIFNLLLKLYKIDKGKITIDNEDIYAYSKDVHYSNIGVVNQKTFLFNMSIRANLSLVDSNKKRQIEVCKRVGIHDFIMSLPKGYNTVLKEDATNISGGQKQLLSLARTLLTKAEIILLDEVTSSLDPNTIKKIINLMDDLKTDHTLIVITHNRELMKNSDTLIVLANGKVDSIGSHQELLHNSSVYNELYTGQNGNSK